MEKYENILKNNCKLINGNCDKLTFEGDKNMLNEDMEPLNPDCKDAECRPEFWVPENKLCLYCSYRG